LQEPPVVRALYLLWASSSPEWIPLDNSSKCCRIRGSTSVLRWCRTFMAWSRLYTGLEDSRLAQQVR